MSSTGFTISASDPAFDETVTISATINRGGLTSTAAGSRTVRIVGSSPQELVFGFSADQMVDAELQFSASSTAGSDAFTASLPVLAAQDSVFLATSMQVDGTAAGTPWAEGIALPDAVPGSGSLSLSAGVGYLPTVEALDKSVLAIPEDLEHLNGLMLVNSLAPAAMLPAYVGSAAALQAQAAAQVAVSARNLALFSDESGLRYSQRKNVFNGQQYINTGLNAWASLLAQRLDGAADAATTAPVTALALEWRAAMITGPPRPPGLLSFQHNPASLGRPQTDPTLVPLPPPQAC